MKLLRKDDPYAVEKLWLKGRGIDNPAEESLVSIRKRNRIALTIFVVLAVLFLVAYLYFLHSL